MTPWPAPSGRIYDLCLLDTNIVSDCLKNREGEGKRLFEKYLAGEHALCIPFHTLIELRRRPHLFNSFLKTFSVVPWFLLKPWGMIELEELESTILCVLLNAFSPQGRDESYDARQFIMAMEADSQLGRIEADWRDEEEASLDVLKRLGEGFIPAGEGANAKDAGRFLQYAAPYLLRHPEISVDKRPAAKVYLFSIYYRLFGKTKLSSGEMTDVRIAALAPYVDVFCTENFQASVFERIRTRLPEVANLTVVRLRDLRRPKGGPA